MKNVILFLTSILFISCASDTKELEGELYFKLVELIPSNGFTKDQLEKVIHEIDNEKASNEIGKAALSDYLKKLRKEGVLGLPHVNLKLKSGKIVQVFLKEENYQKLKPYTLEVLKERKSKVLMKLNSKKIDEGIYLANEITDLKEIKGETPWSK